MLLLMCAIYVGRQVCKRELNISLESLYLLNYEDLSNHVNAVTIKTFSTHPEQHPPTELYKCLFCRWVNLLRKSSCAQGATSGQDFDSLAASGRFCLGLIQKIQFLGPLRLPFAAGFLVTVAAVLPAG